MSTTIVTQQTEITQFIFGQPLRKLRWAPFFLLLFVFSGFSFICASMLLFAGPQIVSDTVTSTTDDLERLKTRGIEFLRSPEYEDRRSHILTLQVQLHQEITNYNPGYCGIGPAAIAIINNISSLFPPRQYT
jgi:hypothetical protein